MPPRKTDTYSKLVANRKADDENSYTPEKLWEKAREYFLWAESNPLKEEKAFSSGKRLTVNKIRAMSTTGFCVFAGIGKARFRSYLHDEAYAGIMSQIADVIYTQKFEAAAAGLLETSIISRELGLREQTDITSGGKNLHIEVVDESTKEHIKSLHERSS